MKRELPSAYNAKEYEAAIYQKWEKGGFFRPGAKGKPFSIIMPPPNANGSLHIGHAVFVTLEDIMTRYHRMRGDKTLWLPGADHAGFETQVVYEKKLEKEGRTRFGMDREQLWKEIWDFTQANKKHMEGQLRMLGASCDWSREKFTLDPDVIKTVYVTFKRLYDDGLIYRADRMVNWCTKHQTALSDLEVDHPEQTDALYYLKYGPLTVATVRPEPIAADVAVAVHPSDKRYKKLIGTMARIPLYNKEIPIIADAMVDPEFGTGAVKVTPSVDPNDFELAQKHGLPIIPIVDQFGKMTEAAGKYAGMSVMDARKAIVEDLKTVGAVEKIDEQYAHRVSVCYKCHRILEPRILPQWYVAMAKKPKRGGLSLRDAAVLAVKKKQIAFVPKRMEKIFMHWMRNLRDWNISRQIVWGIRIPVWYRSSVTPAKAGVQSHGMDSRLRGNDIYVGAKPPTKDGWVQETDVFDTWFSSGQWPFVTLGGAKNKDFKTFYPTTVMETGWDILFFWVARMMMLGLYVTGKAPFKYVYLHGLVRDKDRQKMSKSKGNVIDPLGVVEQYGADALRMALIVGNTPGNDIIISEEKIKGYRNFANKIWNISRFVLMNQAVILEARRSRAGRIPWSKESRAALKHLDAITKKVTAHMDNFKFYQAADDLYHYVWHEFADKVIEQQKARLSSWSESEGRAIGSRRDSIVPIRSQSSLSGLQNDRAEAQALLLKMLATILKLLHPFMPYVTEAIWTEMPIKNKKMLIVEQWPK
ncbi:valine--tRNA ligase [Candidatus Uhrbacteria bacterium RIFCSPLOWO2_02_FULL_51_9]|uniref:Valine--tRNA ligase n=1 Tax=Candidatus Uhrbacteria bacterium RIFCSPLOWO2_02_FULL_51_9 TaxID=1802410 RepID=A0A1F7VE10_9BACT|nr:MAG: valine--tRNA ligase [Candidatus Uhrbacteria bacterium RIFCSPLOWO2_02_FULL_51_9]